MRAKKPTVLELRAKRHVRKDQKALALEVARIAIDLLAEPIRSVVCPSCGDENEIQLFTCGSCRADLQSAKEHLTDWLGKPRTA